MLASLLLLPLAPDLGQPFTYGTMFGLLLYGLARGGGRYLVGRAAVWIGRRSYSAYFWHIAVNAGLQGVVMPLYLRWVVIVIATLALSDLSYRLVEQPGIRAGKSVVNRMFRRSAASPVAGLRS